MRVLLRCVAQDTTAESIFGAVAKRTAQLAIDPGRYNVTVLSSDSAKSMIRVMRHYVFLARNSLPCQLLPAVPRPGTVELAVHARCMMHMLWAAVCAMFSIYDMISSLYCATTLIHRGQYMRAVTKSAKRRILEIPIEYGPRIEPALYNKQVVALLDSAQSYIADAMRQEGAEGSMEEAAASERRTALATLARRSLPRFGPNKSSGSRVV